MRSSGGQLNFEGDEEEDNARGIYHLRIGSDKGILKSIKFRRDDIAGRREGRVVRAGGANISAIREKYDATITLVGAPFIHPGAYLYVNPSSVGYGQSTSSASAARVLGLGGYYFVNKVQNSISSDGNFETTIEASWSAFADDGRGCQISNLEIISATLDSDLDAPPPSAGAHTTYQTAEEAPVGTEFEDIEEFDLDDINDQSPAQR